MFWFILFVASSSILSFSLFHNHSLKTTPVQLDVIGGQEYGRRDVTKALLLPSLFAAGN
jgi:hypothetical protein